ncbi:MAG: ParB/RepB/Spo0J family partition protein [Chloroflexi bacterium]|nr:MAG: ParB/RepB/Spo0J family partition protein [Chloroflexota bacterium]
MNYWRSCGHLALRRCPVPSDADPAPAPHRSSSRGLGRGLAALIPEGAPLPAQPDVRIPTTDVPIELVVPNPWQPRSVMEPTALAELTDSIREHGIIQPLLVSVEQDAAGATIYQLIAGERRLRAARAAGLLRVPVTIRQSTPRELLELAIIENVQRADLSPLEESSSYQRLIDEFHLTQQEVAVRVGKSRAAVANTLRLAALAPELQASLANGEITEGHARALLGMDDSLDGGARRRELWRMVVEGGLNVRQTERLVREAMKPGLDAQTVPVAPATAEQQHEALAQALQRSLGTKVTMRRGKRGAGSLTIHYYSDEELEGVLDRLGIGEL